MDERFYDNPLVTDSPKIRFYAGCPLTVLNGSKLGTLCLIDQEPRAFDDDDRTLLRDLARMVEMEIAAVQLASMDELTLLSNRRGFEALSQHALHVCNRLQKPVSMLFFDLNDFKQINDQYGHAEGDRALTTFSNILMEVFRDSDVVGRLGGDEFVVLLTNTSQDETSEVLKRLQAMITDHNVVAKRGYDIAYSVGTTQYDTNIHSSIADLINAADQSMYIQKKNKAKTSR